VVATLLRAHLCEQLADLLPCALSPFELFLTGIYSQIDVLIGIELAAAVRQAPVPSSVRDALLSRDGPLWSTLQLAIAWEDGDWVTVATTSGELRVDPGELSRCYAQAIEFADTASVDRPSEPA
jgi:EAL and modified HD-GYP domain-containing signal transduction protein